jgi:hypothetical protein
VPPARRPPRFHVPLRGGDQLDLPPGPARHAQVLRLQFGDLLTLFNGEGGEWAAEVLAMSHKDIRVQIGEHHAVDRELAQRVTLALGMPANERMDTLGEKASELGVAVIQPLLCERSVLRLSGERVDKKQFQVARLMRSAGFASPVLNTILNVLIQTVELAGKPRVDLGMLLKIATQTGSESPTSVTKFGNRLVFFEPTASSCAPPGRLLAAIWHTSACTDPSLSMSAPSGATA